ncbi:MAG: UvrD/REP helicase [Firmicutes bacterium]|nr:UvrD/REP helicase [Bacillota bacterium]
MSKLTPDQQAAIETLDRNLLVKAGAGAGKTRVLVERYIHILETDAADMDGIVAITFTRKAAREMKERIRSRVEELMALTQGTEAWGKWRKISARLDALNISTIHSLCSRILREHPAEAGVDPDFGLMEDLDEQALLDEVWQVTLEEAIKSNAPWLGRLLAIYSPAQVRQSFRPLFDAVLDEGALGPDLAKKLWPVAAGDHEPLVEQLKQDYQELFALVPTTGKKSATHERLLILQAKWPELERQIESAIAEISVFDDLDEELKNMRGGEELREALQQRKATVALLRGVLLDQTVEKLVPDLCEWFGAVGEEWARVKRLRRMLTYDDLEKETEKLLLGQPEICARYNRRFRFLMVDECQDINERQRKIIYLLAGGDAAELRSRNLFAVGDGKQSIYRFRGADSRVFARLQEDVGKSGGQVIELLQNFRSHQQLVSAFNDFFAGLMPAAVCEEEVEGADTVEYRNLEGGGSKEGLSRADLWVLDAEALAGGDARQREAEMIARRIRALVEDCQQPVQYRDVAVLLRAFTHVGAYEEAFAKAGIPYYVAGSRGFTDRQEIADVLNLLQFLCNPLNDTALFATLRSPFFQLSDEALLRLRRAGGEGGIWAGLAGADAVEGLIASEVATAQRARQLLDRWLERRGFLTPEQVIREALEATGFELFQLTQFMGVRRYANLMKLQDMAEAFMEAENGGIAEFLTYLQNRAGSEGEAEIDSEAGDTVRIMTIHKSKGLEFPVVIVPDLQRKFISRSQMTVFMRGLGMGMKVPDSRGKLLESGRFRRILRQDNAMERAELKRVLYVAMTRAERQIILSAVANSPKTEKNLRNASGWLDWARHLFCLEGSPREWPSEKCIGETCLHISLDDGLESIVNSDESELVLPAGTSECSLPATVWHNISSIPVREARPQVVSPAYLAEYASCPRRYYYSHIFRVPMPSDFKPQGVAAEGADVGDSFTLPFESIQTIVSSVSPLQLGTAFHKFLELLPNREAWQESLTQAVQDTLPPSMQKEAVGLMQEWASRYAGSALYGELAAVKDERREWAFQYRLLQPEGLLPAVWLSGQVDRVLFYPDGTLGIIDYKTDHLSGGSAQKKAARYRLQLLGYVLAARAVFGLSVRDARLYFVRSGETASIDVGAGSLAWAQKELQAVAGFIRSHREEADYPCKVSHCPYCPFAAICPQETTE